MIGAKVNGRLVTIDYNIRNGDRIEVLTSANSKGPSRDWLNLVKSTQAKNKINQWFRNEFKEENIVSGKELLNNYCKAKSINFGDINKPEYQAQVQRKYGFRDWDSVLAAVGHGGLKESQIVNRMMEEYRKDHKKVITDEQVLLEASSSEQKEKHEEEARTSHKKSGIIVKGLTDVAVHFSKCCIIVNILCECNVCNRYSTILSCEVETCRIRSACVNQSNTGPRGSRSISTPARSRRTFRRWHCTGRTAWSWSLSKKGTASCRRG